MGKLSKLSLVVFALIVAAVPAFATDPTMPTIDYTGAAGTVLTQVGTIVSTLLPYMALIFCVFLVPKLLFRLIRGSKG